MTYKDVLEKASEIGTEAVVKSYNLYNEGKKVVGAKVNELKDKTRDIVIEIEVKPDNLDTDVGKAGKFAYAYALSYINFHPEDDHTDPGLVKENVEKLMEGYNPDVTSLEDYVKFSCKSEFTKQVMDAYIASQSKKGASKFTDYKYDLAAKTSEDTYLNYKNFFENLVVSTETEYLLLELTMEIVKYCFKHKGMASMSDVMNVLRGKNLKAEDGTKIDFGADLVRCLANEEVKNLMIAILRVEYKDTYMVNINNI